MESQVGSSDGRIGNPRRHTHIPEIQQCRHRSAIALRGPDQHIVVVGVSMNYLVRQVGLARLDRAAVEVQEIPDYRPTFVRQQIEPLFQRGPGAAQIPRKLCWRSTAIHPCQFLVHAGKQPAHLRHHLPRYRVRLPEWRTLQPRDQAHLVRGAVYRAFACAHDGCHR